MKEGVNRIILEAKSELSKEISVKRKEEAMELLKRGDYYQLIVMTEEGVKGLTVVDSKHVVFFLFCLKDVMKTLVETGKKMFLEQNNS